MDRKKIQTLIDENPDYVYSRRHKNSLTILRKKYGDGPVPIKVIASALLMTEDEVQLTLKSILKKLRTAMNVQDYELTSADEDVI